ncbi:hypothetical protein [Cypionkella sp.]|uniref:hypothetical protein n=1 Tax=Cypionkella sp. TaxID=2811411 RepID=UPI0026104941|nr:hypothetical protein [Cypionkella sp.]
MIALLLAAAAVQAQEACTKISAPVARLNCYDQWAGKELGAIIISDSLPPGVAAAEAAKALKTAATSPKADDPAPVAASDSGKWVLQLDKSAMKDTTDAYAKVLAQEDVQCASYGDASAISLTLRCLENTTALMVGGNCHLASGFQGYGEVTYRIGDRKARSKNFEVSTDNGSQAMRLRDAAIPCGHKDHNPG